MEVDKLLAALTGRPAASQLVILHGEAGAGKTSLIQAGLTRRLIEKRHLPLPVRVSKKSLVEEIKRSVIADLEATPGLKAVPLNEFLRRVSDLLPKGTQICVLLDPFEAFFDQPGEARQDFIGELARCLDDVERCSSWLISIRSARLANLSEFQPSIQQPLARTLALPPLSCRTACRAILKPARRAGYELEDGLLRALLSDLGEAGINPSSLQMVCHHLVEGLPRGEKRLTLAGYEQAGRAQGILRKSLDLVLERHLLPADRELAWQVLAGIIQNRLGAASLGELVAHLKAYSTTQAETQRMLDLLEINRLVQLSGDRYHLAHPGYRARIRQWADQQAVLEQARVEAARQLERIRDSALRGLLGGAVGMALAYLLAYFSPLYAQILPGLGKAKFVEFLILLAIFQALPGAIAGLCLTLLADIAQVSYRGPRRRLRWLVVGAGGAGSFSAALLIMALLNRPLEHLQVGPVIAEGALWGLAAGLGTEWALSASRPAWQTLPPVALACGLVLWLAEGFGHAFESPIPAWPVAIAGAVMPFLVVASTLVGRKARRE
jgi:hypothetical protein